MVFLLAAYPSNYKVPITAPYGAEIGTSFFPIENYHLSWFIDASQRQKIYPAHGLFPITWKKITIMPSASLALNRF